MFRLALIVPVLALLAARPDELRAQQPQQQVPSPRVSTVIESADEFYRQLDYVMGLTTPEEQQQTANIKEHFDVFLIGVEREKPLRMDLLIDPQPFRYQLAVPVANLRDFRFNNLVPLGLNHRQIDRTRYHFRNNVWIGFMRYVHDYAIFGEFAADIPPTLPDPRQAVNHLFRQGYQAAFDMELDDPALMNQQQQRRQAFNHPQGIRRFMLDSLEQGATETNDEFALRKLTLGHQLDEFERLYAESTQSRLGWTLDAQGGRGRFELTVAPIPDTDLANMIAALGQQPSRFNHVPRTQPAVLSARVNHPLDQMRQDNFRETFQLLADINKRNINDDDQRTAEQKQAASRAVDLIYELFDANLRAGLAEGFAEVQPRDGGRHTGVAAMRTVDGRAAVEILRQLAASRPGRQVQFNAEEHGGVAIHTIQVREEDHPGYGDFFGDNRLYVGSSQEAIWLAAGVDSLAALKTAIDQAAQPLEGLEPRLAVDVYARLRPFVELMHKRLGMADDPRRQRWRRLALEAFQPGDDVIDLRLGRERETQNLRGQLTAEPGILRYVGKLLADFSRENLQDN